MNLDGVMVGCRACLQIRLAPHPTEVDGSPLAVTCPHTGDPTLRTICPDCGTVLEFDRLALISGVAAGRPLNSPRRP